MRKTAGALFFLFIVCVHLGCDNASDSNPDTYNSGTIHISCDETFKPVIDAQVQVYLSDKPDARIIVHYKPEAECLKDFFNDSIRIVIATRGFTERERAKMIDSVKIGPTMGAVARDAIAVIVHPLASDSFFTVQEIRDIVSGKHKETLIPVFDGLSETSTVRFMLDSVLQGGVLGPQVTAARSTQEVLDYVSKVKNAVGFVGISWIGNKEDTSQRAMLKKIRIARVESSDSAGYYVQPVQYLIYTGTYPLIRDLVYVIKENHKGLGQGFVNFLKGDRGQLIFRRSYLQPLVKPYYVRRAELEEEY